MPGVIREAWRAFLRHVVLWEGSTRLVAVMRVLLVLQAWSRWSGTFAYDAAHSPARLLLAAAFWVSTVLLLVGLQTRVAAAVVACCAWASWYGLGLYGGQEELAHHHTRVLAMGLTLLALTPCGASFSADRWLAVRAAARAGTTPPPERGPLWAQRVTVIALSGLYAFAAYEKTYPGFLSGARLEHIYLGTYFGSENAPAWLSAWSMLAAVTTVVVEYALAVAILVPRTRFAAVVVALLFHGVLYHQINVGTFTCTMAALLLACLDPDRFHAATERLS